MEHWHCECCGKNYADAAAAEELETVTAPIDPDNHLHTINQGHRAPTATVPGYSGDVVCTDCLETVERGQFLPATGSGHGAGSENADKEEDENPFLDVEDGEYFYDAVLWAVENGITTGTTGTTFSPNGICTRAQAVTFLWRAAGSPEPKSTSCAFTDVDPDSYYYKAVLWAVEEGITTGVTETTFAPNEQCTRAQIVTFLWRFAGKPTADTSKFADVKTDAYYYEAVAWAVEEGITTGIHDTAFAPDCFCTRAQIVTFLFRRLG